MHIQADHSSNESVGPRFTVDELRLAIATLSAADLGRLKQAAKVFSGISGIMEDDLIQDPTLGYSKEGEPAAVRSGWSRFCAAL